MVWYDQTWKWRADGDERVHWRIGYGTKDCAISAAKAFIDQQEMTKEHRAIEEWCDELWEGIA